MSRANGADYFCGQALDESYPYGIRGKVKIGGSTAISDFTLQFSAPDLLTSLPSEWITGTGSTQTTAAALTVNTDCIPSGPSNVGYRLPAGAAVGDRVSMWAGATSGGLVTQFIYPPVGGKLDTGVVNAGRFYYRREYFICQGSDLWYSTRSDAIYPFNSINADASGNMVLHQAGVTHLCRPDGVKLWRRGLKGVDGVIDESGNVYSAGYRNGSPCSMSVWDVDGNWLWGHKHLGISPFTTRPNINLDPEGDGVIVSGCLDDSGNIGPCKISLDVSFVANPWT
ncbi:hypothetical protein [Schlesneria paludicola]|uniref:hypothetical protein n=1 Tax=Schlesneria paludicola TaxID=360056 RepID=UPI0012FA679C|nr:hypothetical protein [Schlesneria paludicola]